jgi:hypothetical protein
MQTPFDTPTLIADTPVVGKAWSRCMGAAVGSPFGGTDALVGRHVS